MSLFDFLKPKEKTTEELQAELRALVMKLTSTGLVASYDMDRYESLLSEIYKRGEEPEYFLKKGDK